MEKMYIGCLWTDTKETGISGCLWSGEPARKLTFSVYPLYRWHILQCALKKKKSGSKRNILVKHSRYLVILK